MIEIPGKRKGSALFLHDDFSYNVDKRCANTFRCAGRRGTPCYGILVAVDDNGERKYVMKTDHNHDSNPDALPIYLLKKEMLEMCSDTTLLPRTIFDTVCRRHENVPKSLTFQSVKSILIRERDKSKPIVPETVDALSDFLREHESLKDTYKGTVITEEGEITLLFSNTVLLEALASASEIFVGCEYLVVPTDPPMKHMMTIHIRDGNVGIVTAFVLCEELTEATYRCIWKKLLELVPGMKDSLTSVISDYEKVKIAVIHECFPDAKIYGSWFGFKQAIWHEWLSLKLATASRDLISMAMTLPLAPRSFFEVSFKVMQDLADAVSREHPAVLQFMTYMRTVWLPNAQKISVYGRSARTSNIVESFQRTAASKLSVDSGLWIFFDGNGNDVIIGADLLADSVPEDLLDDSDTVTTVTIQRRNNRRRQLEDHPDVAKDCQDAAKDRPDAAKDRPDVAKDAPDVVEENTLLTNSPITCGANPQIKTQTSRSETDDRHNNNFNCSRSSSEYFADTADSKSDHSNDDDRVDDIETHGHRPNTRSQSSEQATAVQYDEYEDYIYDPPEDDYGYWLSDTVDPVPDVPFQSVSKITVSSTCTSIRKPGTCCVCLSVSADQHFQPCNHMCCCEDCASNLDEPVCPLCKREILSRTTVILS